jgi:hypothetical protein
MSPYVGFIPDCSGPVAAYRACPDVADATDGGGEMSAMDGTIQAQSATVIGKLRSMLVATLVAGLIAGFGLGRVTYGSGSSVAPDRWVPVSAGDYQGPGHVPRHWIDRSSLGHR